MEHAEEVRGIKRVDIARAAPGVVRRRASEALHQGVASSRYRPPRLDGITGAVWVVRLAAVAAVSIAHILPQDGVRLDAEARLCGVKPLSTSAPCTLYQVLLSRIVFAREASVLGTHGRGQQSQGGGDGEQPRSGKQDSCAYGCTQADTHHFVLAVEAKPLLDVWRCFVNAGHTQAQRIHA